MFSTETTEIRGRNQELSSEPCSSIISKSEAGVPNKSLAPTCITSMGGNADDAPFNSIHSNSQYESAYEPPEWRANVPRHPYVSNLLPKFDDGDEAWLKIPYGPGIAVVIKEGKGGEHPLYKWSYTVKDAYTGAAVNLDGDSPRPQWFPETQLSMHSGCSTTT
ncbi:uncharacterized protein BDZ99DRAFT_461628 [Mytilinidion resinicola]|uniref:Uncharacterized protein n=1 Tax=Mytilinidion resinicola TaxID=574789 RepID=A0A6A6YS35_9PEZI|nr:uncharacterized protein BDZ99DRAFT_461628 [Mytilinidion resinicola]KAF2811610.1 hypothetical protein BDZ99DRAFT_461628 [Mytilinidion resinicola]